MQSRSRTGSRRATPCASALRLLDLACYRVSPCLLVSLSPCLLVSVVNPVFHMPPPLRDARAAARVRHARMLHALAAGSQAVVMLAMFLLWRVYRVPFWTAAERCFTAGLGVYTALVLAAAVLLALARVQPLALAARYSLRLASVGVYAASRYWYDLGFLKSAGIWAALYVVSAVLVRRMERGALERLGA